jgi:ribonuclease Z
LPAYGRHQSAQLLEIGKLTFLIDCGEGTQLRLSHHNIKAQKIDHIMISHLHGDHYLGLVGLLSSMNLLGRKKKLVVHGPNGLAEIITTQFRYSQTSLNYPISYQRLDTDEFNIIFENDVLVINSFPLQHRIPCCGFVWREKPKPKRINKDTLPVDLSLVNIVRLKNGKDILDESDELIYKNESLTLPAKKSRSYAYCSDTKYDESITPFINQVDLLYHESTFLDEMKERATLTFHSTALQAAHIAKLAEVSQLLLGHYSARYRDISPFLDEAKQVFLATQLAQEGAEIELAE